MDENDLERWWSHRVVLQVDQPLKSPLIHEIREKT